MDYFYCVRTFFYHQNRERDFTNFTMKTGKKISQLLTNVGALVIKRNKGTEEKMKFSVNDFFSKCD